MTGEKNAFYLSERLGDRLMKLPLRGGRADMEILAVTPSLVLTGDWGLTKLALTKTGWLEPKGQGGFLCSVCLHVVRDKHDLDKHKVKHM